MSIVLTTEQREQAGSDSYNRFEYQVHWVLTGWRLLCMLKRKICWKIIRLNRQGIDRI